jgi:predicted nucleic acid-binding protein
VSAISYVETLGYPQLSNAEEIFLERFVTTIIILLVFQGVIEKATQLRQQRKMSLEDALIATAALVYKISLITRNIEDFIWIKELGIHNPFVNT